MNEVDEIHAVLIEAHKQKRCIRTIAEGKAGYLYSYRFPDGSKAILSFDEQHSRIKLLVGEHELIWRWN